MSAGPEVRGGTPVVGRAIDALAATVIEAGGGFATGLRVDVRDAELSIARDARAGKAEVLMAMPAPCLPPTSGFRMRVGGDDFVVEADSLTPAQDRAVRQLIDIYNACGKVAAWRRVTPWLTLAADPALFDHLRAARGTHGAAQRLEALRQVGDWDRVLVDSFLKSRVIHLARSGPGGRPVVRSVLMLFIDFLNHHLRAGPYRLSRPGGGRPACLVTGCDRPVAGSDECFVFYNVLDSLDTLLTYGYSDPAVPFLVSVPVTVPVPGGRRLVVTAEPGPFHEGALPPALAPFRIQVPRILARDSTSLVVNRLVVPPPDQAGVLAEVLDFLAAGFAPDLTVARRVQVVADAQVALWQANRGHLDRLEMLLAEARTRVTDSAPPGRGTTLAALDALVISRRRLLDALADRLGGR